jgi:DNA repair protein RadA/Sms
MLRCDQCGWVTLRWRPLCPSCRTGYLRVWELPAARVAKLLSPLGAQYRPTSRVPSGVAWFDRFMNGGFPRARTTLIYGKPSTGKSRLAVWLALGAAAGGARVLYVTAEEPLSSLDDYGRTMGAEGIHARFSLMESTDTDLFFAAFDRVRPDLVVWDSWQKVRSITGKLAELVEGCTKQLVYAYQGLEKRVRATNAAALLVSQATHANTFAGSLKHIHNLDSVVLKISKDARDVRTLRFHKTRSGPEGTVMLAMDGRGILWPRETEEVSAPDAAPRRKRRKNREEEGAED